MNLEKLNYILISGVLAFVLSFVLYPFYIKFLQKIKAGKQLRDDATSGGKAKIFQKLHKNKIGTPTMGGALFLLVLGIFVMVSIILKKMGYFNFSLWERRETYIVLFAFFSMGILGLIDDFLNIKGVGKVKGLTAKMKLIWMFLFSAFISYWMFFKLNVDYVVFWHQEIYIGWFYLIFTFIFTVALVNAVNITDGLDGLAGGLLTMILAALAVITYFQGWYLTTTILVIVVATLIAFLWYNINPAKVFMGDSGALALGGLVAAVIYLLGIKLGIWTIIIPLLLIIFLELFSSFIQIFWKKTFKKKLFAVAPFHHFLEYKGKKEYTIVMKFWLIQGVLTVIALIIFFYQLITANVR